MLWPKKNHTRYLITKKNSCGSKIPQPSPPPLSNGPSLNDGEVDLKALANGRNIVGCYMLLPFAHPVAFCWMLLRVVAQSLKPVKLSANNSQHFFCSVITET